MNYMFYGVNFITSIISVSIPDKLMDTVNVIKKLWSYFDIVLVPLNITIYIIQFFYKRKMDKN
jgi:hypothetical protein